MRFWFILAVTATFVYFVAVHFGLSRDAALEISLPFVLVAIIARRAVLIKLGPERAGMKGSAELFLVLLLALVVAAASLLAAGLYYFGFLKIAGVLFVAALIAVAVWRRVESDLGIIHWSDTH